MRKIFLTFLVFMLAASNVASAEILRISEMDVQKFVHSIANTIYTDEFQKKVPLLMSNAAKIENIEMPEIGSTAWACQYGLKTSAQPDGEIIFFTDNEEKVSAVKIVGYSEKSAENAGIFLFIVMKAVGLTQTDAEFLVNNLKDDEVLASSMVWSKEKNCCFLLMAGARPQSAEGFQFMLMASDKQN